MKDVKMHGEIKEICQKAAMWMAIFFIVFAIELNLSVSQGFTEKDLTVSGDQLNPISIKLSEEGIPVISLEINLNEKISNSQLKIRMLDPSQISGLDNPLESAYGYFLIEHNIPPEMISSATLTFMIEESWLSSRNLLSSEIVIKSNSAPEWKTIQLSQLGSADGFRTYSAQLTSAELSAELAIAASKEIVQSRAKIVQYRQPAQINFPRPELAAKESAFSMLFKGSDFGAGELILALVIIILTSGIVAVTRMFHSIHLKHEMDEIGRMESIKEDIIAKSGDGEEEQAVKLASAKRENGKQKDAMNVDEKLFSKLKDFIHTEQSKGRSRESIMESLKGKRWPNELVEKAFDDIEKLTGSQRSESAKIQDKIIDSLADGKTKKELKKSFSKLYEEFVLKHAFKKVHELENLMKEKGLDDVHHDLDDASKSAKDILSNGYSKKALKKALRMIGWPDSTINKLF